MLVLTLTHRESIHNAETIVDQLKPEAVEIRYDLYPQVEVNHVIDAINFYMNHDISVIFCFRKMEDGGEWSGDEVGRLLKLKEILQDVQIAPEEKKARFFIDLEEGLFFVKDALSSKEIMERRDDLLGLIKEKNCSIVASFHDFERTPPDIPERMEMLLKEIYSLLWPGERDGEEVSSNSQTKLFPKAAVKVNTSRDLLSLMKQIKIIKTTLPAQAYICLGMGYIGLPSRILSNFLGSAWSYVSGDESILIEKQQEQSVDLKRILGHISLEEARSLYNFDTVNGETKIFGIIGNPVAHSKSPDFHNKVFAESGAKAIYLPFQVDDLDAFFEMADQLHIMGLSVTVPWKNEVLPFCSEVTREVSLIGSANTLVRETQGWKAYNTDYLGFMAGLEGIDLKGKRGTIIGAGGASKAIVFALLDAGMDLLILNRTVEKAENLAQHFLESYPGRVRVASLAPESSDQISRFSDLLVQTTSLGMEPREKENPLDFYHFQGHEMAYDIVYTPEETQFLKKAAMAGARTISGKGMFIKQAEEQAKLFLSQIP